MKLRLKGNAFPLRLSQTESKNLAIKGFVEEGINFSKILSLSYRLELNGGILKPNISYAGNKIAVFIPQNFTNDWPGNNVAGTSALHTTKEGT